MQNPRKLFASTLSAFNCPLSCENTVSTLRRKRKISCRICIDQFFLLFKGLQWHQADPFLLDFIKKGFPSISFISKDYQTKAVLCKLPEPLPVIHWGRGALKSCGIALQGNQGMDLEAKIGLFFGRTPAIICTICTERTAIPGPPKLTDCNRLSYKYPRRLWFRQKSRLTYHTTQAF